MRWRPYLGSRRVSVRVRGVEDFALALQKRLWDASEGARECRRIKREWERSFAEHYVPVMKELIEGSSMLYNAMGGASE